MVCLTNLHKASIIGIRQVFANRKNGKKGIHRFSTWNIDLYQQKSYNNFVSLDKQF